jgi:PKD repeat protein
MKHFLLAALLGASSALAQAQTLTTTMVGGLVLTGYTGANTLYFDVNVTAPNGILVSQFDLRTQTGTGTTGPVTVYRTALGGTQATNRANPTAWTVVGTANVNGVGTSVATLQTPFYLAAGQYGIAIHMVNIQAVYTNPATPVPALPTQFSNADLTINCIDARIQNSTPTAPISGGVSAVRTPNLVLYYTTDKVCNFTASTTAGNAPLAVQFNHAAATTQPGGILAYAWDFDGDNVVDSTAPNPQFTYSQCGTYTVSLTVVDANGPLTETKSNFIVVDPLTVDFTWTKIADPALFQFTALTSSSATNWAWDLDGDGNVDSTQQNPLFAYAVGCGSFPVTLTANNNCRNGSRTKQFVPLPSATTLFDSNNAGVAGSGLFFDVTVTNPDGISLCAVSVNINGSTGTSFTADVYTTPGTYVGNDANAAAWTLVGSGNGTSRGLNNPSTVSFAPVYLAPGAYGFAVYVYGIGPAYSGTGSNPAPGLPTYSNADLRFDLGLARNGLFGSATTVFTPRIWNGSLHYETVAQGLAVYQVFGAGCAGPLGVPGNQVTNLPHLGQTASANFTNLPINVAFHMLGFSRTFSNLGPLPASLAPFGAPGCSARVSADAVSLLLGAGNQATFTWTLPNNGVFLGMRLYNQALALSPGTNALGGVLSDAAMLVIGN